MRTTREEIEHVVRRYYDGCNEADREKMIGCLTADAVHYFPLEAPQGPFVGARAIAEGWKAAVSTLDSRWTIDSLVIDEQSRVAVVEWTHFKPQAGTRLRGAELCALTEDGRIREIRAYYACPVPEVARSWELGGFDYEARGYPTTRPIVPGRDEAPRKEGRA